MMTERVTRREVLWGIVLMARPFVLIAGVLAYLVGLAYAWYRLGGLDPMAASYGLLVLMTATMMGHYANEYADVDTDSITRRTRFSGGSGVLPKGRVPVRYALYMTISMLLASLTLTALGMVWGILTDDFLVLLLVSLALGWSYSMPPLRLERRGWGEIDNAFLGGFSMVLSGFVPQSGWVDLGSMLFCIPMSLVVMVNLIPVHWSDREADREVGKMTLVARLGERAIPLYLALLLSTYLATILLWPEIIPYQALLLALLTFPYAIYSYHRFRHRGDVWTGSFLMGAYFIAMAAGLTLASL
jgi:1,4-dihydroxy-2-naphthoate octaprenyltransferase